jgi:hypothetical protein
MPEILATCKDEIGRWWSQASLDKKVVCETPFSMKKSGYRGTSLSSKPRQEA